MATEQTVIFTVTPRGISLDAKRHPVSVFVSPRLVGADHLGDFPDWLQWTHRLKEQGLTLVFRCAGKQSEAAINTSVLNPGLWAQLFNRETLVRSHKFNDYTERGIISFSMRQALSALKAIYQEASVTLALPEEETRSDKQERGNRDLLRGLVDGLDVHWNADRARSWRAAMREINKSPRVATAQAGFSGPLDGEGLYWASPDATAFKKIAVPFAVFHRMPTPPRDELKLDTENVLDFHQALSSLNSYPDLLRALGLVFDIDLPLDFVKETAPGKFGTLSVSKTSFAWRTPTKTPELATAYVDLVAGGHNLFLAAPRVLSDPSSPMNVIGLLDLAPERFGLAQVDVDGGMHKTMILSETLNDPDTGLNLAANAKPEPAPHPDVFDPGATLPALRSGGLSLFADRRALYLLDTLAQGKAFNEAVESGGAQPRPFFAEDLVRGYRLDIWDSRTNAWHSLHQRSGEYQIGEANFSVAEEEGFVQLALTQPAKGAAAGADGTDLYIHEAIARWAGWSLSAPRPGKHFSRYADPDDALPRDNEPDKFAEDQPETPFKMAVKYRVLPGSLPRMRFGVRYRMRARAVDLAGNSLQLGDALADGLSTICALPRDPEGFTFLRYEPVAAPLVVLRDERAVTDAGSALDRLVIRTFNDDISKDGDAADVTAAERHLFPPRTSVEMGERLGMFDDATGKLKNDAATWQLIAERDAGELPHTDIHIAGKTDSFPLVTTDQLASLPYLPDPLARGAALRNLPGTPSGSLSKLTPDVGVAAAANYDALSDPNPRPGSATLISFGDSDDWQQTRGLRLALADPASGQTDLRPQWDPTARLLTVFLPKGQTSIVPLTSYVTPDDLKLLGVWQWLREYVERLTLLNPRAEYFRPGANVDRIAHILQRAVEGGHWMLTPPTLLTLVHAVQQPLGKPAFTAFDADFDQTAAGADPLQTTPIVSRQDPTEFAPLTSWRRLGATDAFLTGALKVHGASTAKVDLLAEWDDPVDDLTQTKWTTSHRKEHVEELPLHSLKEDYLTASGKGSRRVGYYDPEHDQIAFVRTGERTRLPNKFGQLFYDAAPRHLFNDTKHHRVTYTPVATSRYREYFPQDQDLVFSRTGESVTVDVPASARPLAPSVAYVLPTFGWQRQTETNLKRSVRFGGGLRVYLHRPWFSSGVGELLGVALWSYQNGSLDAQARDKFKPFFTQWGIDPIWATNGLYGAPGVGNFPDLVAADSGVSLEEASARKAPTKEYPAGEPGRIDVVGFPVAYDESRKLWYADLMINTFTENYSPFVRLAVVRYQPQALADAKVSRVVLADFAQLTPDRVATVTSDPHHPRTLRVVVSGVAPRGPQPLLQAEPRPQDVSKRPTQIRVRLQQRDDAIQSDLAWQDVAPDVATVNAVFDNYYPTDPDLEMWAGLVTFAQRPEVGRFRLLVEEYEYVSANYVLKDGRTTRQPGRLIYAESFELDDALISET